MGNSFFFQWEVDLMEFVQALLGSVGAAVASVVSMFGEELVLVLVLGFMYWSWDKKIGRRIGLNIVMGVVWNPLIKNIALRRRPYFDNPGIKCLKPVDSSADIYDIKAQGWSFPSGHSANSTIAFGSIAYYYKKKAVRIICILLPILVGISRFCVGVHYPTDVICGWALGAVIVFLMPWLLDRAKHKALLYLIIFIISLSGCFWCRTDDYYTGIGMMAGFFLGDLFEEKYVRFENTRVWWRMILRVVLGGAIFFGLNVVLKLPFPGWMLKTEDALGYAIRAVRYAVILFVEVGVYPLAFRLLDRKKA
ncbi:MAG: phosphatase PAP2 family protein [Firmicutes bacterium]|nr:phosphatase PAP2 family protein [Bacillota bacterium]